MHEGESHPESPYPDHDDNSKSSSPATLQQTPVPAQPEELKSFSTTTANGECLICENTSPQSFWFCGVCKLAYCDVCWNMQVLHRVESKARVSTPHEKTPLDIADKVGKVLTPTEDLRQRVSPARALRLREDLQRQLGFDSPSRRDCTYSPLTKVWPQTNFPTQNPLIFRFSSACITTTNT
jgi:hypothetical protein